MYRISSGLCPQSNCMRLFNPLFDAEFVAVQTSLTSNCGEFAIIKIRVVDLFSYPEKFNCVSVSQPVGDEKVSVFRPEHISQGDIILVVNGGDRNFCPMDNQFIIHSEITSILQIVVLNGLCLSS